MKKEKKIENKCTSKLGEIVKNAMNENVQCDSCKKKAVCKYVDDFKKFKEDIEGCIDTNKTLEIAEVAVNCSQYESYNSGILKAVERINTEPLSPYNPYNPYEPYAPYRTAITSVDEPCIRHPRKPYERATVMYSADLER